MSGLERIREVQLDERYSVREDGTVLSNGMALSPVRGVWVSLHGERRYVSYLVARAFVPNPEGRPYVVHKDGDPENNEADNLEWSEEKEPDRKAGPKPRMCIFGQFDVDGSKLRTLVNQSSNVVTPTYTVSRTMSVVFGGVTYTLITGDNKNENLALQPGDNEMQFFGTGRVTVAYREVSL